MRETVGAFKLHETVRYLGEKVTIIHLSERYDDVVIVEYPNGDTKTVTVNKLEKIGKDILDEYLKIRNLEEWQHYTVVRKTNKDLLVIVSETVYEEDRTWEMEQLEGAELSGRILRTFVFKRTKEKEFDIY